jgi:tRNA(adenine34) deaminase
VDEEAQRRVDERFMREAVSEAHRARTHGDVPVGAVVVRDSVVIGRGHNRREVEQNPLAHAEMVAIREAALRVGGWRLIGCSLYVPLEPCCMCAGALVNSRVETLVYGTEDPKAGFCGSLGDLVGDVRLNHRLAVRRGIMQPVCSQVLREFFAALRR